MPIAFGQIRHFTWRASQVAALLRGARLCAQHQARYGRKPVIAVIGARYGVQGVARLLAGRGAIQAIGFEPDQQECERLRTVQPFARFEPYALGDVDGPHPFFITAHPGCASCLAPDPAVLQDYPIRTWFGVKRTIEVDLHRFDTLHREQGIELPDFIQMDVQGFESRVIAGLGSGIDRVVGLECEAHLKRIYKGQLLLPELAESLSRNGLILREIRPQGMFEGEVVEANVWFTRASSRCTEEQRSLARIWETISLLPEPLCCPASEAAKWTV